MKYDVYFHNDFDGRASVAVFLDFLRGRGDSVGNYVQVDHWISDKWDALVRKSKNPFAVFDFYFHPRAVFFFDHHATTFRKKSWERNFKNDRFHHLRPEYKSCCKLVFDALKKNFGYRPKSHIKDLVRWAEVVDAADYSSPRLTIEVEEPALEIDIFVDERSTKENLNWLIELISRKPLREIARLGKVQKVVKMARRKIKRGLLFTRKNLQIFGKVTFLDLSLTNVPRVRFAPHYLYPELNYTVTLMKDVDGFRIAVGGNPWRKQACRIDLGRYAKAKYGGGGHRRAAGITKIRSRKKGLRISQELIEFLNR